MDTIEAHLAHLSDAVSAAGVQVVHSPLIAAPEGAGDVYVPLDDDEVEATLSIAGALSARLVIFGPVNPVGFDVHVIGNPWVQLSYITPEALAAVDADADVAPDFTLGLDDHGFAVVNEAVDQLTAEVGLSDHGRAFDLFGLISERILRNAPEDGQLVLATGMFAIRARASEAFQTLKDDHARLVRTQARELAQRILAEEGPFTQPFLRPAQRDVTYRWLKRLDPTCTTRESSDLVALELGALVNTRQ